MLELFRNNVALALQYAVNSLVPLLLIPHIVREIGLAQFGLLAIALTWANYGALVVQYAFRISGPARFARPEPGETPVDVVCRITSAKLLLLGLVLMVSMLGALVTHRLGYGIAAPQAWLLIAIPVAAAFNTGWHLQAINRFGTVSLLSILGAVMALGLGLSTVRKEVSGIILLAAFALSLGPLLSGVTTFSASALALLRSVDSKQVGWRSPWPELRAGWPLFASQVTSALYAASGPIVVGLLAGAEQAGAYGAVEKVSTAVCGGCLLIYTAAYPRLARLYAKDRAGYRQLLQVTLGAYLAMAVVVVLTVVVLWQPVQHFLLGSSTAGYDRLLAAALVWVLLGIFGTALTGYWTVSGQGGRVLPLTARVLALSVLLGVPGVMIWGAWAWLAALCTAQLLVLITGYRVWTNEIQQFDKMELAR